ncbi:hypothetical protein [Roseibium album]|uniref:hypothetical protein n=1 Tax=Roseibium album TaxID=311410 RepID=UPI00249077E8|nr:hypothetical protein [Roseibium album]
MSIPRAPNPFLGRVGVGTEARQPRQAFAGLVAWPDNGRHDPVSLGDPGKG